MNVGDTFIQDGVSYKAVGDQNDVCRDCAFRGNRAACRSAPPCPGLIFIPIVKASVVIDQHAPGAKLSGGLGPGRKDDSGKLDVTLFMDDLPHAIEAVTEVLQWAITKKQPKPYERGSWQMVQDFQRRYRGAQLRHELNRAKSVLAGAEPVDAETGLLELAHIATDAMFRLEMEVRKQRGLTVPEGA